MNSNLMLDIHSIVGIVTYISNFSFNVWEYDISTFEGFKGLAQHIALNDAKASGFQFDGDFDMLDNNELEHWFYHLDKEFKDHSHVIKNLDYHIAICKKVGLIDRTVRNLANIRDLIKEDIEVVINH